VRRSRSLCRRTLPHVFRYAETQGWKVEILESSPSSIGGLKEVVAAIQGQKVYSKLKYESGVHRVQRVPATETQGRIHTPPQPSRFSRSRRIDIKIEAKDLRVDTFCSSGPGGQSVTPPIPRSHHAYFPADWVVSQQDEKSQIKIARKPCAFLRARLYEQEQEKRQAASPPSAADRLKQATAPKKIRTYNFPRTA